MAKILSAKKKERIVRKVITKGYTDRILRQSQRLTGNQSLLATYQTKNEECTGGQIG